MPLITETDIWPRADADWHRGIVQARAKLLRGTDPAGPGKGVGFYWPPFMAAVIAILGFVGLGVSRFVGAPRPQTSGNSPT